MHFIVCPCLRLCCTLIKDHNKYLAHHHGHDLQEIQKLRLGANLKFLVSSYVTMCGLRNNLSFLGGKQKPETFP